MLFSTDLKIFFNSVRPLHWSLARKKFLMKAPLTLTLETKPSQVFCGKITAQPRVFPPPSIREEHSHMILCALLAAVIVS